MPRVLAYHFTWGTYGSRLHGDPRGTVERQNNIYGTPVLAHDAERLREQRENLRFPPVSLTIEQCAFAEDAIPAVCERGHWELRARACAPDHIHVVLTSVFDPKKIRSLLKRWVGQALSENWSQEKEQTWWSEDGSIKWIYDDPYLRNAVRYVERQRIRRVR